MKNEKYGLTAPFVTNDPLFAIGFEAGTIFERLKRSEPFEQLIQSKNIEQIRIICEESGRSFQITSIDDTWSTLAVYLRLFTN